MPAAIPSLYQNSQSRTRPSQNAGADTKKIAEPRASRSQMVRCFTAEITPMVTPSASQMIAAPMASDAVTTMRPADERADRGVVDVGEAQPGPPELVAEHQVLEEQQVLQPDGMVEAELALHGGDQRGVASLPANSTAGLTGGSTK